MVPVTLIALLLASLFFGLMKLEVWMIFCYVDHLLLFIMFGNAAWGI